MDHEQSVGIPSIESDPSAFIAQGVATGLNLVSIIKEKFQYIARLSKENFKFSLSAMKNEDIFELREHFVAIYDRQFNASTTLKQRKGLNANSKLSEDLFHLMIAIIESKPLPHPIAKIVTKSTQNSEHEQNETDIDELISKMYDLEAKVTELSSENKTLKNELARTNVTVTGLQKLVNQLNNNANNNVNLFQTNTASSLNSPSIVSIKQNSTNNQLNPSLVNKDHVSQSPSLSNKRPHSLVDNPQPSKSNTKTLFTFDSRADNPSSTLSPLITFKDVASKGDWNLAGSGKSKKQKSNDHQSNSINSKVYASNNSNLNFNSNNNRSNVRQKQNPNWKKSEIVGTKTGSEFKISVRKIPIYLGRISNEMSTEEVENQLKNMKITFSNLEQIKTKHNFFKSFSFLIDANEKNNIMNPDIWPKGVVVNRLISVKNKKANDGLNQESNNGN